MALFAAKVPAGSNVRSVSVPPSLSPAVRAYGFSETDGYAFVLFNNRLKPIAVAARLRNSGKTSFTATLSVYGAAQYDQSKQNRWTGPVTKNLGTVGTSVPLTLPPYSISILSLD
jgi:hypothetical protein